ncbi:MAG: NUDIX domain-containing protein [Chloroflexota bacterium]|nr:NUDIX domain-containing protein [Chloroflexota bacterium]
MALALIRRRDEILVGPVTELDGTVIGRRPPGGTIEFGESGSVAVIREMREELGAEITDVRYVGTIENIYRFRGKPEHELVRVYEARFSDPSFYARDVIECVEADGQHFTCIWRRASDLSEPLFPEGLLELIHT